MENEITNEIYINKLPIGGDFVYILSDWSKENIVIKILEEKKTFRYKWQGVITKEILDTSAKDLNICNKEFKEECKLALLTYKGKDSFSYFLEDGTFKLQKCKRLKTTYFYIQLEECIESLGNIFLDYSVNITGNYFQTIVKKDEELHHLKAEAINLIIAREKCEKEKNDLEATLFSKFILLLNSKKNRIKKLESILQKEGIQINYGSKKKTEVAVTDENKNNEIDLFEDCVNDDVFDAKTQVMVPEETQTLDIVNLPKRQKISDYQNGPSTSKEINCSDSQLIHKNIKTYKSASSKSRLSPASKEENSSEEYFAKM